MAIVLSGSTNDITVNGVSVATDAEVSSAITDAVQTGLVALQTIVTGTATFTATTNNINLTGIGVGIEIGDVIQISGAEDAKNNSEFTVEVITDANNVIVNQAHANKGTSKNIAARVNDTGVTIKLLAKWYNAPTGLGQDWVTVTSTRAKNTVYNNITNRTIVIGVTFAANTAVEIELKSNNISVARIVVHGASVDQAAALTAAIGKGSTYGAYTKDSADYLLVWAELR